MIYFYFLLKFPFTIIHLKIVILIKKYIYFHRNKKNMNEKIKLLELLWIFLKF
jgi:hypothetical protein